IYHTDFKDLVEPQIVFVGANPSITFNNILKARIQGAELTFRSLLGFVGIETSLTALYARALTDSTDRSLKFRSPILWYNRLWIPLSEFEVQFDYRFIARAERILDDNERIFEQFIPDVQARVPVHVLDARLIYNMAKADIAPMKLILNAKNILNYYYVEVIGNLAPIRQFSLQCEVNL
ncbi:MAG TPA: TonB-dependent receptor, partial [Candidatus Kapabacteria bacterium]|nr:TonB-dependent receptor [Candidatus Kapabacteria bacterium]